MSCSLVFYYLCFLSSFFRPFQFLGDASTILVERCFTGFPRLNPVLHFPSSFLSSLLHFLLFKTFTKEASLFLYIGPSLFMLLPLFIRLFDYSLSLPWEFPGEGKRGGYFFSLQIGAFHSPSSSFSLILICPHLHPSPLLIHVHPHPPPPHPPPSSSSLSSFPDLICSNKRD